MESDSKQQQAAIHSKPGTLGEKIGVLNEAAAQKLAPATEWIREKANAVLPESITHANRDAEKMRDDDAQKEGDVSLKAAAPSSVKPAADPISFRAALTDVGTHTYESIAHTVNPIVAPIIAKVEPVVQPVVQPLVDKLNQWKNGDVAVPPSVSTSSADAAPKAVEPADASLKAQSKVADLSEQEKEKKVENL